MQPAEQHLAAADLRQAIDYLERLHADLPLASFPQRVIAELPALIDADVTTYCEVDGEHHLHRFHCYPATTDSRSESGAVLGYCSAFAACSPLEANGVYRLRDALTGDYAAALQAYRQLLVPLGSRYQLVAVVGLSEQSRMIITLHRSTRDFPERDRMVLEVLRPHLLQAHRSAELIERAGHALDALRKVMVNPDRAVVVLDARGKIKWWTQRAREWVRVYCNAIFVESSDQLPECFHRWYQQQLSLEAAVEWLPSADRALLVERPGSRLVVHFIPDHLHDEHILLLELERMEDSPQCLAAFGLSPRECEALFWVAKGKSNSQVGTILHLSTRTVEKHLERVYVKLGVETRTAAALRAQALLGNP